MAKNADGVISPCLDKYSSNHSQSINKSSMHTFKGYDDIKHKAFETHDNLYNDYNNVKHKLFKNV